MNIDLNWTREEVEQFLNNNGYIITTGKAYTAESCYHNRVEFEDCTVQIAIKSGDTIPERCIKNDMERNHGMLTIFENLISDKLKTLLLN